MSIYNENKSYDDDFSDRKKMAKNQDEKFGKQKIRDK